MRVEVVPVERQEALGASACRHHWVIESPQGATSQGVCKICGARREFYNYAPDGHWEPDALSELASQRWGRQETPATDEEGEEASLAPRRLGEEALLVL